MVGHRNDMPCSKALPLRFKKRMNFFPSIQLPRAVLRRIKIGEVSGVLT